MPLTLPPVAQTALLLDIDGTLLDLAPTPDAVVVPPDLLDDLRRLRRHLGGALGMITGRPLDQVDQLLPDISHAAAGEHGGALRHDPGGPVARPALPEVPAAWYDQADVLVAAFPGSLVERKRRGFVLHYRLAPTAGPALRDGAAALVATEPARFQLLAASMAWEVRPVGVDKGIALAQLCAHPPFAGRRPVYIGDDVTDADGIERAIALGGAGLWVDRAFGDPAGVRAWLRQSADAFDAGATTWPAIA